MIVPSPPRQRPPSPSHRPLRRARRVEALASATEVPAIDQASEKGWKVVPSCGSSAGPFSVITLSTASLRFRCPTCWSWSPCCRRPPLLLVGAAGRAAASPTEGRSPLGGAARAVWCPRCPVVEPRRPPRAGQIRGLKDGSVSRLLLRSHDGGHALPGARASSRTRRPRPRAAYPIPEAKRRRAVAASASTPCGLLHSGAPYSNPGRSRHGAHGRWLTAPRPITTLGLSLDTHVVYQSSTPRLVSCGGNTRRRSPSSARTSPEGARRPAAPAVSPLRARASRCEQLEKSGALPPSAVPPLL